MGRAKKGSTRLYLRGATWWCYGYDATGKRWRESTHQPRDNKRAAELAAREIERRYAADSAAARAPKVKLADALAERIDAMRRHARAESTIYAAAVHMRHLAQTLGPDTLVTDISLASTTRYMELRMREGASKHTIHKELIQLCAAWKRMHRLGLLPPCPDLRPDELRHVYTPGERYLTRPELAALLDALDRAPGAPGRPATDRRSDYVLVWAMSGVRRAELYSYRPGDYDEARREWSVRGTKTEGARRTIPVGPEVHDVLVRRREAGFPEWGAYRRDILAACRRAGIPAATCNDFRRTFATWCAEAGVPEQHVAKLMGHASTAMVRRVYSRLQAASLSAAVRAISLRPEPPPTPLPQKTLN